MTIRFTRRGGGRHGQVMQVPQERPPIDPPIGGYHHGTTEKAENRHRARRQEVVALDVRRDARQRGAREQARRKYAPQQGLTAPQRVAQPKPKIRPLAQTKRGAHRHQPIHPQFNLAASLPQVQIDPLVEGYRIAVATGLPVASHTGLHQRPLTLVVVVGCHLVRQCWAWAHDAHPFCQDEKTRLPAEMLRLDS